MKGELIDRILIVDASVAAKWFIDEEYAEASVAVLDEKNSLHAPDFLLLEIDSIIGKWIRRGALGVEEGNEIRNALRRFPIRFHPFLSFLDTAFAISVQTGRSVYDCLYVALATVIKGRMVTADRKLYNSLKTGRFKKHVLWVGDI